MCALGVYIYACVCACMCARVYMRVYVRACVRVCVCVCARYLRASRVSFSGSPSASSPWCCANRTTCTEFWHWRPFRDLIKGSKGKRPARLRSSPASPIDHNRLLSIRSGRLTLRDTLLSKRAIRPLPIRNHHAAGSHGSSSRSENVSAPGAPIDPQITGER